MHLADRIHLNEVFRAYIPDFTYKLVRIHDYTNEELLNRKNEISFLMMINRIQNAKDLTAFLQAEHDEVRSIIDRASPQLLEIIADTIWSLCMKMNVPVDEAKECVRKVKERNMGYLFENMEKIDVSERYTGKEARTGYTARPAGKTTTAQDCRTEFQPHCAAPRQIVPVPASQRKTCLQWRTSATKSNTLI